MATKVPSTLLATPPAIHVDRVVYGLTISNNGTDATNDIDIAAGVCVSDDGTLMTLTAITKQLDASWAVGTNAGARDTGSISDNWWHVWVINRPDTNVTDVLLSLSRTSPTMPTNYTKKKCIGAIHRTSGAIRQFTQTRNVFRWKVVPSDASTGVTTSRALFNPLVPPLQEGILRIFGGAASANIAIIQETYETDAAPLSSGSPGCTLSWAAGTGQSVEIRKFVDASSQIAARSGVASTTINVCTLGYIDHRI